MKVALHFLVFFSLTLETGLGTSSELLPALPSGFGTYLVAFMTAPISLNGFFGNNSDSDDDHENDGFQQVYSIETVEFTSTKSLKIRQFSWHSQNANQVWPGALKLASFIDENRVYNDGTILELGAATGALAIYLQKYYNYNIVTSDYNDGGEIEENIKYNCELNGLTPCLHLPYSWGDSTEQVESIKHSLKYIIASDILLYVKAYPYLVDFLFYLFENNEIKEFLMSWQRRIDESKLFFDLMESKGFRLHKEESASGIYSFTRI